MPWKTGSIEPDQAADIGGRYSARAKLAQAGGLRRFRQLVAGRHREQGGDDGSAARPDRAAPAAGGGPRLRETGRGRAPRRSRLARRRRRRPPGDSWSAFLCAPGSHRPTAAGSAATVPVSPAGPAPVSTQVSVPARSVAACMSSRSAYGSPAFDTPVSFGYAHVLRIARIKRRAVGIARPGSLRLAACHQARNLGAALETRIDQAHGLELRERAHGSRRSVRIAAAPAISNASRARPDLRRSPPRIPAGSAPRRYPRCAATAGRHSRAPCRH